MVQKQQASKKIDLSEDYPEVPETLRADPFASDHWKVLVRRFASDDLKRNPHLHVLIADACQAHSEITAARELIAEEGSLITRKDGIRIRHPAYSVILANNTIYLHRINGLGIPKFKTPNKPNPNKEEIAENATSTDEASPAAIEAKAKARRRQLLGSKKPNLVRPN
jgi:phage terminase small subunit